MIDEDGNRHTTPPAGIPPHMLDAPTSRAQKKAFAKVKRDQAKAEEKPAPKSAEKTAKK